MVSDTLAAAIARAAILKSAMALPACRTDSTCISELEPMPAPERLYVSMGAHGVRIFTLDVDREHGAPVTEYVQRSALDAVVDALAVTFHCLKLSHPETLPFSNTTVMGRDVSTMLTKYGKPS